MRLFFILIVSLNVPLFGWCQSHILPLNNSIQRQTEHYFVQKDSVFHSSLKPYTLTQNQYQNLNGDSLYHGKSFWKTVTQGNFLEVRQKDFYLSVNPIFNFETGNEFSDTSQYSDTTQFYTNTRGFYIQGEIGKTVSFYSAFYENQAFLPTYQRSYTNQYGVIPGQGRVKEFKSTGFDYAMSSGAVLIQPIHFLDIQVGYGKHFIGNGYRSILLSDFSHNYPFLKLDGSFLNRKIKYSWISASLQSMRRVSTNTATEAPFEKKGASFYYLNYIPHPSIEIGLFEGIIWQVRDSLGAYPFNAHRLNPVMLTNSVFTNKNKKNIVGLNFKWNIIRNAQFYFQMGLDNSQLPYQIGVKTNHLLVKGLTTAIEYNKVSKSTYLGNNYLRNYSHFNEELAHPLGNGFNELIVQLGYGYKNWELFYQFNSIEYKNPDLFSSLDNRIFNPLLMGTYSSIEKNEVFYHQAKISYRINPANNMKVELGLRQRNSRITTSNANYTFDNQYFYIGFRTDLANRYYDY